MSDTSGPIHRTKVTHIAKVAADSSGGGAALVVLYPPGPDMGKILRLDADTVVIGRGADTDLQLDRDSVSRRHAQVYRVGGGWLAEDLGSTNGTYLNDAPIQRSPLRDGDFLKIGAVIFKVLIGKGIEASYYEEIYRLTITDALTEAHSKRYFLELLTQEIARCGEHERPLSLLLFDIDHFKTLNDTHGHLTGDYVLRELSRRVRLRLRTPQVLARYGGEEFAVMLPEVDQVSAEAMAEEIRTLIASEPLSHEGDLLEVTVSLGVASLSSEIREPTQFIKMADEAMHRAKRQGRNCVYVADSAAAYGGGWVAPGEIGADSSLAVGAPTRVQAPPVVPVPLMLFRRQLESWTAKDAAVQLLAATIADRDSIAVEQAGGAILDDLETALVSAVSQRPRPDLLLGRIADAGVLLIAVRAEAAVAERLRGDAIERQFQQECQRRGLRQSRAVCGPAVVIDEVNHAIRVALDAMKSRQAEAEQTVGLPLAIAWALRNAHAQKEPIRLGFSVIRLHEQITRWVLSIGLAELWRADATSPALEQLSELLHGSPATLGRWVALLRQVESDIRKLGEPDFAFPEFANALRGKARRSSSAVSLLGDFVSDRNHFVHGGAAEDSMSAQKMSDEWLPKLEQLLDEELAILRALRPLHVSDMDLDDDDDESYRYQVRWLIGDNLIVPPTELISRQRMRKSRIYLVGESSREMLSLDPFVIYENKPGSGGMELFILDSVDKSGPAYVSPVNGFRLDKQLADRERRATRVRKIFARS